MVQGVSSVVTSAVQHHAATQQASTGSASGQAPFANLFQSMMQQTSDLDAKAQTAVTGLLNGTGVEVHEAMIAMQKADMAFEMGLQVRNKAVAAYQQMMSMQF